MVSLWPEAVFDCVEEAGPDYPEDIDDLCETIRRATKGFGTDEEELIQAIGSLGPVARYHISKRYEEYFGDNLRTLIKKECGSSDFGYCLQLLAQPIHEAECAMIQNGNDKLIWSTLCGRTNQEIEVLRKTYYDMYEQDLAVKIAEELSGDVEKLVTAALQANEEPYDPDNAHTEEKVEEDARAFDKAGRESLGTDEAELFRIICESPPEHLREVNKAYVERRGYGLIIALEKELGGDAEEAAIYTVNMKIKPELTAVRFIEDTMKGFGTDETTLTCAIIRYQTLLGTGFSEFEEEFGESLEDKVKGETRGDFEKLLLEVINCSSE